MHYCRDENAPAASPWAAMTCHANINARKIRCPNPTSPYEAKMVTNATNAAGVNQDSNRSARYPGLRRPASRRLRVAKPAAAIRLNRPTIPAAACNICSLEAGPSIQRGGGFSLRTCKSESNTPAKKTPIAPTAKRIIAVCERDLVSRPLTIANASAISPLPQTKNASFMSQPIRPTEYSLPYR